jgi:hypothetical protein
MLTFSSKINERIQSKTLSSIESKEYLISLMFGLSLGIFFLTIVENQIYIYLSELWCAIT